MTDLSAACVLLSANIGASGTSTGQRIIPAMTSSELTGGAGFTFEDSVVAYFLVSLLCGNAGPALSPRIVERVALQQKAFGEPLDDLVVDAISADDNTPARLSLQVKRALRISSADSNTDFREVIEGSWHTFQKPGFRNGVDRFGAVAGSIAEDKFRDFNAICGMARASLSVDSFKQRFGSNGNASADHLAAMDIVRSVSNDVLKTQIAEQDIFDFLRHFVLIKLDFLHEGSVTAAHSVAVLQQAIASSSTQSAHDTWNGLLQLARNGAGKSEEFSRSSLLNRLPSALRLVGSPSYRGDAERLQAMTSEWLALQDDRIGGVHIRRESLQKQLAEQIGRHQFVLIKGLPGAGKTALLHELLARYTAEGTTLLLAANQLSGRSWGEFATVRGLHAPSVEAILAEVAATGNATLFIDGLDRVEVENRPVVSGIIAQILSTPTLERWRIVATARDSGIESIRSWLPPALMTADGVGYVSVGSLDDEESLALAKEIPSLRPLLLGGDERVRDFARRPFFAAMLARGLLANAYTSDFQPRSEIDLVRAWWRNGGYNVLPAETVPRQQALLELAHVSAPQLGQRQRVSALSPATREMLHPLEQDGVVRLQQDGLRIGFAHDILFEWAFLHQLMDHGEEWINALVQAGEQPALGRVVELLSQVIYEDFESWQRTLNQLKAATVRPHWLRAWLLGPLLSPSFAYSLT